MIFRLFMESDMDIRYTTIFAVLSVHCVSQTFTICNTAFSHYFWGEFFFPKSLVKLVGDLLKLTKIVGAF